MPSKERFWNSLEKMTKKQVTVGPRECNQDDISKEYQGMHRLLRCLDIMYEVVGCRINAINLPGNNYLVLVLD